MSEIEKTVCAKCGYPLYTGEHGHHKDEESKQTCGEDNVAETDRRDKLIEKMYAFGKGYRQLEALMSDPGGFDKGKLDRILEGMPESCHEKLRTVVDLYKEKAEKAKTQRQEISSAISERGLEASAENIGRWLFSGVTFHPPEGRVNFKHVGAYFILSFEELRDLKSFNNESANGLPESGGRFHREVQYISGEMTIPILALYSDIDFESAVIHESQHFINHELVNMFSDEATKESVNELMAKDELLAYLRDGRRGKLVEDLLISEPLYGHLWEGMALDQRVSLEETIRAISKEMESLVEYYPIGIDDFRIELVGMLLTIPIKKWPSHLRSIRLYEKRQRAATPIEVL